MLSIEQIIQLNQMGFSNEQISKLNEEPMVEVKEEEVKVEEPTKEEEHIEQEVVDKKVNPEVVDKKVNPYEETLEKLAKKMDDLDKKITKKNIKDTEIPVIDDTENFVKNLEQLVNQF